MPVLIHTFMHRPTHTHTHILVHIHIIFICLSIIRLLIQWGAKVNSRTRYGDTPAHLAAFRGYANMVSTLLQAGARADMRNDRHQTVIYTAMSSGRSNVVRLLERHKSYLLDLRQHPMVDQGLKYNRGNREHY